jgi:hypothetical protein
MQTRVARFALAPEGAGGGARNGVRKTARARSSRSTIRGGHQRRRRVSDCQFPGGPLYGDAGQGPRRHRRQRADQDARSGALAGRCARQRGVSGRVDGQNIGEPTGADRSRNTRLEAHQAKSDASTATPVRLGGQRGERTAGHEFQAGDIEHQCAGGRDNGGDFAQQSLPGVFVAGVDLTAGVDDDRRIAALRRRPQRAVRIAELGHQLRAQHEVRGRWLCCGQAQGALLLDGRSTRHAGCPSRYLKTDSSLSCVSFL